MRLPAQFKFPLALASLGLVVLALYCLWLWQPERQVLKHHENLLLAAEKRSWNRFTDLIDPQYSDRWGHDRVFIVRETREWLRQFFALTVTGDIVTYEAVDGRGRVVAHIKLDGNGTALAQLAKSEVNSLREPFVFEWKRKSWK